MDQILYNVGYTMSLVKSPSGTIHTIIGIYIHTYTSDASSLQYIRSAQYYPY